MDDQHDRKMKKICPTLPNNKVNIYEIKLSQYQDFHEKYPWRAQTFTVYNSFLADFKPDSNVDGEPPISSSSIAQSIYCVIVWKSVLSWICFSKAVLETGESRDLIFTPCGSREHFVLRTCIKIPQNLYLIYWTLGPRPYWDWTMLCVSK